MSAMLSRRVLILNKCWTAISVTNLQRAVTLLFSEHTSGEHLGEPKARIIDPALDFQTFTWDDWTKLSPKNGEDTIKGVGTSFRVPEVIMLTQYDKLPQQRVHFSRKTIYRRDSFTCFTSDTLILMSDFTLKLISEIEIGDKVIDAYGQEQVVEFVHLRKASPGEVVSIKHRGNGDPLCCTKDHKILEFNYKDGHLINSDGISADKLNIKSCLGEVIPTISESNLVIDLADLELKYLNVSSNEVKHYCGKPIKRFVNCDNVLGRLCGYYLSEGSINNNTIIFSLNSEEFYYAHEIKKYLLDIFGVDSTWTTDENRGKITVCSSVVSKFFEIYFGKSDCKHIGLKPNIKFLEGVLYGLIRGDASFSDKQQRCSIMMSRPNLIREIYLISLICGLKPTLSKTGVRKDGRIYKIVNYNADSYNKICEISNLASNEWKPKKHSKIDRNFIENKVISKITCIKEIAYDGYVYDLQVSGSHTYIANFVCVHNCQYCGDKLSTEALTIDHIVPRSRGGQTTWENCVLACVPCNKQKADRMLVDCYRNKKQGDYHPEKNILGWKGPSPMKLASVPKKPQFSLLRSEKAVIPKSWQHFISIAYWECELENDNESLEISDDF